MCDQWGRRPFLHASPTAAARNSPGGFMPPKSACVVSVRERFRGVPALMLGEFRRARHMKAAPWARTVARAGAD